MSKGATARRTILAVVVGLAFVLLLFVVEHDRAGGGKFLRSDWAVNLLWLAAPLILLSRVVRERESRPAREEPGLTPLVALFFCMVLFLFSGAVKHPWFYFLKWYPSTLMGVEGLDAGLTRSVLLTSLTLPFVLAGRRRFDLALLLVLVLSQVFCFASLMRVTGGEALYRDDHPSFLFRLWEFSRTFPRLVTYNPYWNGGVVNFVGTTSGTAAIGIPLYPLWRLAETHVVYTPAIGFIYIVVIPWTAVLSLRIMRAGWPAALCAGVLALGVSRHFFLWALHFGTVGASFASSFVLPVTACVYRAVCLRRRETWLFALLVVSTFLLLQWPPGALMAAPVALSVLLCYRRWTRRTWGFLAVAALVVLVLCLRPVMTILMRGNALMGFVMDGSHQHDRGVLSADLLRKGWDLLWAHIIEGHPLLIFLGLGGAFVLPYRHVRRWCWPILLALAVVAGWGSVVKPNLQLGRMAIPLFFVAVIPASLASARLLCSRRAGLSVVRAGLMALLILGGWNVARLYANKGAAPFSIMSPRYHEFVQWLADNTPRESRVLFAGRTVHYYGGGHIAYLPRLTGREMMADDYYAFPVGTIEYNYPPVAFRRPESRILEFMNLYNVSHVVMYRDEWKEALRRHPESFNEIKDFDDLGVAVFRVASLPGIFVKGSGRIDATFNRIEVALEDADSEAVLRYNWADGLTAPPPVELFPWDAGDGISFIGVHPNGCAEFGITFRSGL